MVEMIDFEELPEEEEVAKQEKNINITFKVTKDVHEMFTKIAKRERRKISSLGSIIVEDYINNYVENYKAKQNKS